MHPCEPRQNLNYKVIDNINNTIVILFKKAPKGSTFSYINISGCEYLKTLSDKNSTPVYIPMTIYETNGFVYFVLTCC